MQIIPPYRLISRNMSDTPEKYFLNKKENESILGNSKLMNYLCKLKIKDKPFEIRKQTIFFNYGLRIINF